MNNAVTLSLISHTNVGKTTLARTLLRQDVGEALDQPHVTDVNTAYTMLERDGEILRLWDTPGFGDTARLLRRLKTSSSPLGWFMSQVWDRFTDRPLWCSQQAMANVRDEADVVLYLINAAESPGDAGYVDMEMEILEWVGKPVIVLLNQTGTPGNPLEEEREEELWSEHLKRFPGVCKVLALDAFARCWVQEGELLDVIAAQIPPDKSDSFSLLSRLWKEQNLQAFHQSMTTLAEQLAGSLLDREEATKETILQRVGIGRDGLRVELNKARKSLAERLADRTKVATNRMIEFHELEGRTASRIAQFTSSNYGEPTEVSEPLWSAIGGVAAGAAGGLVADLLHGGLSFGGGTVLGAILGGPGAYLLARGYNLTRSDDKYVRWSQEHFISQSGIALLSYLAIAHFGRGRGKWEESAHPELWEKTVHSVMEDTRDLLESIWKSATSSDVDESKLEERLEEVLVPAGAETLRRLYPDASIDVPDGKSLLAHLRSLPPRVVGSSGRSITGQSRPKTRHHEGATGRSRKQ